MPETRSGGGGWRGSAAEQGSTKRLLSSDAPLCASQPLSCPPHPLPLSLPFRLPLQFVARSVFHRPPPHCRVIRLSGTAQLIGLSDRCVFPAPLRLPPRLSSSSLSPPAFCPATSDRWLFLFPFPFFLCCFSVNAC